MQTQQTQDPFKQNWKLRAANSLWTFLTVAAILIFFYIIQHLGQISAFVGGVISSISPILCALVIAYLLNPIVCFYEKHFLRLLGDKGKKPEKNPHRARVFAAFAGLFTAIAFIGILCWLAVPEIISSLSGIVKELPSQMDRIMQQLESRTFFDDSTAVGKYGNDAILSIMVYLEDWLMSELPSQAETLFDYFYTGVKGAYNVVYTLVIGMILSLYVTIDKYRLQRQIKQLTYSILPTQPASQFRRVLGRANQKFSSAIIGKSFDSIIIGMLCFILLTILNALPFFQFPYPVLLAVIVGVTNVVPFFGPFVGAAITGVLVLFNDPIMVIPYLLMILVLQQFDCNYLDPHIVGNSIGLRPFWSIFAVLLGSALIGIPGFVIGQPVFAFIYEIVSEWSESRLRAKHLEELFDIPPLEDFEDFAELDEPFTASLLDEPVEEEEEKKESRFVINRDQLMNKLQKYKKTN